MPINATDEDKELHWTKAIIDDSYNEQLLVLSLSNKSVINQTGDYEAMAEDLDSVFEGMEDAPRSLKAM
ncbi:Hypothetical protein FKW44_005049 [Caligus rogercresseyi]|uniref:Uncharacterized protein n=1 Tax=Caligus rogercresseyi TaxID=217165 RepID=A0A7T8KBE5_CALRO|nr:Hypothetical protein FKW44_005049 [Caligus rogercresseyi]